MESFNWEYFDFMDDDRLARRWKRNCVRNKELKVNCFSQSLKRALEDQKLGGGMVDEDYLSFLNQVVKDTESRNSMVKDGDESGEDDPHYKMFLEKLKEDGKSYVLQVAGKNEVSLYIKYEAEDSSDDELELPGIRKSRSVMDTESLEAAKDLRLETQKNWTNTGRVYMMDCVGSETTYSVVERDMTPEPVNHVFGMENGFSSDNPCPKDSHSFKVGSEHETEVEMVDECYQIYLNGIKGKADSIVPTIEDAELVKDETEVEMADECYQIFLNGIKGKADSIVPTIEDAELVKDETEVEMVDECYQIYLNGIKGKADSIVPTIEDAELVKDEKMDDRSSSESEVLVALNASDFGDGNYSPFETSKLNVTWVEEDGLQCLGNPNTSFHSRYREKLMEKLSESYDHEEYNKLWRDITEERPKERHFHLRSGVVKSGKKYGVPGPSYLEQYPVLDKKISAVFLDKFKVLNLLRGFFFWLQVAFFPWSVARGTLLRTLILLSQSGEMLLMWVGGLKNSKLLFLGCFHVSSLSNIAVQLITTVGCVCGGGSWSQVHLLSQL
ncbi:uncharacterized protein LOC131307322 isoform X1 [Rhododendron vialii]|uniref:uncharacterized protein LOC131307322 isoform X1 n=1 Tax=Rhododendron vialii TaxID=182163 RepID=UPI00266049BA|nr:uncharacterized protein LOC131307322 isoform X1 [Rhododendron vialii]